MLPWPKSKAGVLRSPPRKRAQPEPEVAACRALAAGATDAWQEPTSDYELYHLSIDACTRAVTAEAAGVPAVGLEADRLCAELGDDFDVLTGRGGAASRRSGKRKPPTEVRAAAFSSGYDQRDSELQPRIRELETQVNQLTAAFQHISMQNTLLRARAAHLSEEKASLEGQLAQAQRTATTRSCRTSSTGASHTRPPTCATYLAPHLAALAATLPDLVPAHGFHGLPTLVFDVDAVIKRDPRSAAARAAAGIRAHAEHLFGIKFDDVKLRLLPSGETKLSGTSKHFDSDGYLTRVCMRVRIDAFGRIIGGDAGDMAVQYKGKKATIKMGQGEAYVFDFCDRTQVNGGNLVMHEAIAEPVPGTFVVTLMLTAYGDGAAANDGFMACGRRGAAAGAGSEGGAGGTTAGGGSEGPGGAAADAGREGGAGGATVGGGSQGLGGAVADAGSEGVAAGGAAASGSGAAASSIALPPVLPLRDTPLNTSKCEVKCAPGHPPQHAGEASWAVKMLEGHPSALPKGSRKVYAGLYYPYIVDEAEVIEVAKAEGAPCDVRFADAVSYLSVSQVEEMAYTSEQLEENCQRQLEVARETGSRAGGFASATSGVTALGRDGVAAHAAVAAAADGQRPQQQDGGAYVPRGGWDVAALANGGKPGDGRRHSDRNSKQRHKGRNAAAAAGVALAPKDARRAAAPIVLTEQEDACVEAYAEDLNAAGGTFSHGELLGRLDAAFPPVGARRRVLRRPVVTMFQRYAQWACPAFPQARPPLPNPIVTLRYYTTSVDPKQNEYCYQQGSNLRPLTRITS
ncbi:MAG: hypothetical protein J3K34DRAFT_456564 [Monoraphidium minutum]|nr:MAG: hypothetical protein J3K34DRAFT_456564 [Monoraphidium minutum]